MPNTQSKLNARSTFCLSCHQLCLQKHNLEGTTWYQEKSSLHNTLFFLNTNNCSCNENRRTQNKTKQKNSKQNFMCTTTLLCQKQTNKKRFGCSRHQLYFLHSLLTSFFFFFSTMISEPRQEGLYSEWATWT